jgi:hypothetical protein
MSADSAYIHQAQMKRAAVTSLNYYSMLYLRQLTASSFNIRQ